MGCCLSLGCSSFCLFCCNDLLHFNISEDEWIKLKKDYFEYSDDDTKDNYM
jgi:hypothetical protein